MNWADYCIVSVLTLSVLMGLWRGFIVEVMALVCWGLAFWAAYLFGDGLAEKFSNSITLVSVRLLLGYALCFIVVLIAGSILTFFLRKLVASSGLSGSDRMLGMLFGLGRGFVLVMVTVLLLGFTAFPRDPWWRESQLMPTFQASAEWLSARLPSEVVKYLDWSALIHHVAAPEKPVTTSPDNVSPTKKDPDKTGS